MSHNSQDYAVGQRVTGKVETLLPYGIFVCLNDGTQAYIRRRELTWSGNINPQELWQEGDRIEGIVSKLAGPGQNLELSHRAILPDPWNEFANKFRLGDVIEGTVKNVMGYGIFVEVMPGVDGLVPLPELATWEVQRPDDVVWIGDIIEAVITQLDRRTKKLKLSVRARLRQLELVTGIMDRFDLSSGADMAGDVVVEVEERPDFESELDKLAPEWTERILVIDDYEEVRLPLTEWLRHRGYEVDGVRAAGEAIAKISQKSYGLLFVDLNLPEMDGLAFLRQIRQKGVTCNAVIMSTAEWLAPRCGEIEEAGVIEVFVKPLDLDEIEQLLNRIRHGETIPRWRTTPLAAQTEKAITFQQLAVVVRSRAALDERFRRGLEALVATTSAQTGIIFKLDPVSKIVSMTAHAGTMSLDRTALHALRASPVRDVIVDSEQILESRMWGQVRERFRKLLELLPFESCVGIPIMAGGETHRAIFLFHREANAFDRYHLRETLTTAALFSVAIEREMMDHRFHALNKLLLSGQLASGFSHEVYNKMSGLEIQLHNLQMDCRSYERQPRQTGSFAEIQAATNQLLATFKDLKNTVELFQQLMRAEEEQTVKVNEVIRKTLAQLRPAMHRQRISLETELCPDLPDTAGSTTRLQQIFLNIMLNAIQHMTLKLGGGKILRIVTSYQPRNEERPLEIRFSDTGPGIHRHLWERIFDLGFTTRLGGTGQGLYITRSLVEAMSGRVLVERSTIPTGTTFRVELPVVLMQGGKG